MDTDHPQVPVLDFECDEEIAELLTLMNNLGIVTLLSCQDCLPHRNTVRRVWVQAFGQVLPRFLYLLDRPEEVDDPESLSNRMAPLDETEPDDWQAFRAHRKWHYTASIKRIYGQLMPLEVGITFPYTDLDEVVARLRTAAREIAEVPAEPGDGPEG